MKEAELAGLVTRDAMIGVALVMATPPSSSSSQKEEAK
jgi:hypothetical protein